MDYGVELFAKYKNATTVQGEKIDPKKHKVCQIEEGPADDEWIFFPNITPDYVCSLRRMVSVRFLKLSSWGPRPSISVLGLDPGREEKPEYTPLSNSLSNIFFTFPPRAGDSLDVISMLSICRDGLCRIGNTNHCVEPESSLRGKYVLLFCVFVPARWLEYNALHLSRFAILSHRLSLVNNFEIVIVPKMRKKWVDDADAFQKLLSPFFGRLVVPFSDSLSRDKICQYLHFTGCLKALLVAPDHRILQDNVADILSNHSIIAKEGVPYFLTEPPQDNPGWSLAWLLNAKEGDPSFLLHNLNSNQTISVAQLSKKLVGLYMFQMGDKLNSIHEVYNQCKDERLDFEIVLVAMPLYSTIHPLVFESVMLSEVRKHIPNTSWWVLPYDHCACIRLYKICGGHGQDRMITVGPESSFFVERCGADVARYFGIQSYPFNREVVARRYVDCAKAVTLESLLTFGSIDYLVRGGERVPVATLRGKNVLLYTDYFIGQNDLIYNNLVVWYSQHKELLPDFEVVFVYSDTESSKDLFPQTDTELLVRPFDPEHSRFFTHHHAFFLGKGADKKPVNGIKPSSLLAFGRDGHVVSIRPLNYHDGSINIHLFNCENNYLREEIIQDISCEYYFMGEYETLKPFDVVSL